MNCKSFLVIALITLSGCLNPAKKCSPLKIERDQYSIEICHNNKYNFIFDKENSGEEYYKETREIFWDTTNNAAIIVEFSGLFDMESRNSTLERFIQKGTNLFSKSDPFILNKVVRIGKTTETIIDLLLTKNKNRLYREHSFFNDQYFVKMKISKTLGTMDSELSADGYEKLLLEQELLTKNTTVLLK